MEQDQPRHFSHGPERPSSSAKQSREEEQRRLRLITVEERIYKALGMKKRFSWLQPSGVHNK